MKKAIYLLSVFFCIIAISACQPTPEKEIVVHKAAEQLEATLVESDDKEADSTFICPNKLNEEIKNFVKNRIFLYVIIMQYCDIFFQNELIYSIFIDC